MARKSWLVFGSLLLSVALCFTPLAGAVSAQNAASKAKVPLGLKGIRGLTPAAIKRWNRLIAGAQQEGKLVVIAASDEDQRIYQAFGAEFGIHVTVGTGSPTSLTARILAERQQGLHPEDLDVELDPTSTTELLQAGDFEPILPNIILASDLDRSTGWHGTTIPWSLSDLAKKYITFFTVTPGVDLTIFYNTNIVTPAVLAKINNYTDLYAPRWKGLWEMGNAGAGVAASSRTLGWALLGKKYWTKFVDSVNPSIYPVGNDVFAVNNLLKGQFAWEMFVGSGSPWHGAVSQGLNIAELTKVLKPRVPAVVGAAFGILTNAPDQAAAELFVNWLLAPEGQTLVNAYQTVPGDVALRSTVPQGTIPGYNWLLARHITSVFSQGNDQKAVSQSLTFWQGVDAKLGIPG